MLARHLRAFRPLLIGGLLAAAAAGARGQSIGVDPYDPWNAQYRPFIFPTAPPNPGMPNQGRMDLIGGPTTFGSYLDSVGLATGGDPFGRGGRPGGRFLPYYMAHRQSRSDDRTYQANRDDTFYEGQQAREDRLRQAQRIKDPQKRAAAIRKIQREGVEATRSKTASRNYRAPAGAPPEARQQPRRSPADALGGVTPATNGQPEARGLLDDGETTLNDRPGDLLRSRAMDRYRNRIRAGAADADDGAGTATEPSTPAP